MEVLETRVDDLKFTKTWPHNFKNLISNQGLKKKRKNIQATSKMKYLLSLYSRMKNW